MKGIILAGGTGSRLWPITKSVCKQLLPIYNKPMIYYPITTLAEAGISQILLITNPFEQAQFKNLLGDGQQWGMEFEYISQPKPRGIAEALVLAKQFVAGENCALILGDNLFFGQNLKDQLQTASKRNEGATIFVNEVASPEAYGVIEFDEFNKPLKIIEKPTVPPSKFAVTGLYFYDQHAVHIASSLHPSARGELEITDVNNDYIKRRQINVETLNRGTAWLDTGTPNDLLEAAHFVKAIESRQGIMVGCPEEAALQNGWITPSELTSLANSLGNTEYGRYLSNLAERRAT